MQDLQSPIIVRSRSYESQRDRLREDIALAEVSRSDAALDELDVEGLLLFARHVLTHADGLWIKSSLDRTRQLRVPGAGAAGGDIVNYSRRTRDLLPRNPPPHGQTN
jgi:hypothetical protein